MAKNLSTIEPKLVWKSFEELCQYPRPSKQEEKAIEYLKEFAKKNNLECIQAPSGNVVIRKPATAGFENRKPVAIQGHIDMVCEKNSDVQFDFENDPIQAYIDGDWVKAKGTTLGADNGIGVAMGLAILASNTKDIQHPAIEVLCTLDEETGLTGAQTLETDLLNAKILINLDSEDEDAFTIGCAGGLNTFASYPYQSEAAGNDSQTFKIVVKGLKGGHSGLEIHDGRANAIKLMNRILWNLTGKLNIKVATFNSGSKHNAIPREGFATITVKNAAVNDFKEAMKNLSDSILFEYKTKEPDMQIYCENTDMPTKVMTNDFQSKLLKSIYVIPHGVKRMSPDIAGLVQTSTNLAIVETKENEVTILTSQRSSIESEKLDIGNQVRNAMELGGANVEQNGGYPAWQPNIDSPILQVAKNIYKEVLGREPKVEIIHAGLECGLIGDKYPTMDMLSFGPNLKDVHSPDEKVQISSVQNVWKLLIAILKNIPENK